MNEQHVMTPLTGSMQHPATYQTQPTVTNTLLHSAAPAMAGGPGLGHHSPPTAQQVEMKLTWIFFTFLPVIIGGLIILVNPPTKPTSQVLPSEPASKYPALAHAAPPPPWTSFWTAESRAHTGALWDGVWAKAQQPTVATASTIKNGGIRTRFRGRRKTEGFVTFPELTARMTPAGKGIAVTVYPGGAAFAIKSLDSTSEMKELVLASAKLEPALLPKKQYSLQLVTMGKTIVAILNGQILTAELPAGIEAVAGTFGISGADGDFFRDPEVLNLDGLPEREARELAFRLSSD